MTANGELAVGAGCSAPTAVASSAALSSGVTPNAMRGWLSARDVLGDVPERVGRPDERCSNVSCEEVAQSLNWRIAGPRLLSRLTGAAPEGDHRLEPIDRRSTLQSVG